ncbi:MAG: hypothetical protein C4519_02155 [Desulfobacteraceae bacterium]|nr:MAG: hypothetical protein C4519_02155 [Desulfobacteraceae bacterium]
MTLHAKKHVKQVLLLVLMLWIPFWQGCAEYRALPEEVRSAVYMPGPMPEPLIDRWAPAFLTYGYADVYNRIGRPSARRTPGGNEEVWIDPQAPTVYTLQRTFSTQRGTYTNLFYRVHFPSVPFSLIPFHLTAGDNPGIMIVVTLDDRHRPVLVASVHTCGCYLAIVPTDYLPDEALPENWTGRTLEVYGETLPPRLVYAPFETPRLLVHVRPGVHRITHLEVVPGGQLHSDRYAPIAMTGAPMQDLLRLPFDHGATSFYYEEGLMKGHVKGSLKPFETLLMSLISLDLFVGSDKIYADPQEWGNRFYTSLKFWRRDESDMWDFAEFLKYWGWRL